MTIRLLIAGLAALVSTDAGRVEILFPEVMLRVQNDLGVPAHSTTLGFFEVDLVEPRRCEDIEGFLLKKPLGGKIVCWISMRGLYLSVGTGAARDRISSAHFIDVKEIDRGMATVDGDCWKTDSPCDAVQARLGVSFGNARHCDVSGFGLGNRGFMGLGFTYPEYLVLTPRPLAAGLEVYAEVSEGRFRLQRLRSAGDPIRFRLRDGSADDPIDVIVNNAPTKAVPSTVSTFFRDSHSAAIYDLTEKCRKEGDRCFHPKERPMPLSSFGLPAEGRADCESAFAGEIVAASGTGAAGARAPVELAWLKHLRPEFWTELLNDDHANPFYDATRWGPPLCPKAVLLEPRDTAE